MQETVSMAGSEAVGGAATPESQAIKTVMVVIGMYVKQTIPQLGARIFEGALLFFVLSLSKCTLVCLVWSAGLFFWMSQACPCRIIDCVDVGSVVWKNEGR